ncbi:MAG: hypothetical protein ACM31F_08430, partial [Gemmatimonas sp.]
RLFLSGWIWVKALNADLADLSGFRGECRTTETDFMVKPYTSLEGCSTGRTSRPSLINDQQKIDFAWLCPSAGIRGNPLKSAKSAFRAFTQIQPLKKRRPPPKQR